MLTHEQMVALMAAIIFKSNGGDARNAVEQAKFLKDLAYARPVTKR